MRIKDETYWEGFTVYIQRKKFYDISFIVKGLTKKFGLIIKIFSHIKKMEIQNNFTWILFVLFYRKKFFLNKTRNNIFYCLEKEKINISKIYKAEKYFKSSILKMFEKKEIKCNFFEPKGASENKIEQLSKKKNYISIIRCLNELDRTNLKSDFFRISSLTEFVDGVKKFPQIRKIFKCSFLRKKKKKTRCGFHSNYKSILSETMYHNSKKKKKNTLIRFSITTISTHLPLTKKIKLAFYSKNIFFSTKSFLFCGEKNQILNSWGQFKENFAAFIIFSPNNLINQPIGFSNFNPIPNLKKKKIQINGAIYEKLELIGKGGTGKVYKILDSNKNVFALKKMKIHSFGIENLHSCINEISILKMLRGQNRVVRLENADISLKNGVIYMVLEYGECDLGCLLKQNPKNLSKNAFLKFLWREIIEAVHTIHQERIVHGDLKPANFLIVSSSLKIIDFGIAKPIQNDTTNITRTSQIGTLNYMSPESVLDIPSFCERKKRFKLSRSADIWSLGCIFFQMVYGKTPFHHLSFMKKIQAIVNKAFRIPFLPSKSSQIVDVLKNCLQRNPENRPSIPELLKHPFLIPEIFRISIKKNGQ